MVDVKFRNMPETQLVRNVAIRRIEEAVARFPKSRPRVILVTLITENSAQKPGPDVYRARTEIVGGRYHGLILDKSAPDLYVALAGVVEGLLERLNRFSDKVRILDRKLGRRLRSQTVGIAPVSKRRAL